MHIDMIPAAWLVVVILAIIPLCYLDLISSTLEQHQVFARCPNGTHQAPDGNCEAVTSNGGLPRCPDGYHISPSGICEAVNSFNDGSSDAQQPQMQQQIPQQQYLPQLQQGQPLYNPNQVIACLNHVLVDSMVKAGTTPNLTLHNNTKGVAPEINQTFIQNATTTLDSCIIPMRR